MKVVSWNVNGLRTLNNLQELTTTELNADVLCFQETKFSRCQLDNDTAKIEGFYSFFNFSKNKKGYSGVATYVKKECCPYKVEFRSDIDKDEEGRIIITYHQLTNRKHLSIINVYVPCGYQSDDIDKYNKKLLFLEDLSSLVKEMISDSYEVVVVGDLNVKLLIIDSAEAYENRNNMDFVLEWHKSDDKSLFSKILEESLVDCFRFLKPHKTGCYTCWNSGLNARVNNYGTRIDYILVSKSNAGIIKTCDILSDVLGSDHCPVSADIDFRIVASNTVPPECAIFYPELKGEQQRLSTIFKRKREVSDHNEFDNLLTSIKKSKTTNKSSLKQGTLSFKSRDQSRTVFTSKTDHQCEKLLFKNKTTSTHSEMSSSLLTEPSSDHKPLFDDSTISIKSVLTGLPKPPLCTRHRLKASLKTVNKDGPTKGRRFYCCALPIGPSSEAASSRCNFFQWLDL